MTGSLELEPEPDVTFINPEMTEWSTNEDIIEDIIGNEIMERKSKLQQIKDHIEDKFKKPLSHIDSVYIERKYIKYLSMLWLNEINDGLQKLSSTKRVTTIPEALKSLDNIATLGDLPEPFKNLDYSKLLIQHRELLSMEDETALLDHFKMESWQQTLAISETALKEFNFLRTFTEFLSTARNLPSIVDSLKLKNLVVDDLLQGIFGLDEGSYGAKLSALQQAAVSLKEENDFQLIDKLKEVIATFTKPTEIVQKYQDNRWIFEVKGRNVTVSNVLPELERKLLANPKIEEVRFFTTDFIHFDKDLKNEIWHGKNVVMTTNEMFVSNRVTWNVSGMKSAHTFTKNAGTGQDGDGLQGADGYAGESGGNVLIIANKIDNSEMLTIISNGGDGSNGQDGGNGKRGDDGKSLQTWEFDSKFPPTCPYWAAYDVYQGNIDKTVNYIRNCPTIINNWSTGSANTQTYYVKGVTSEGNEITFGYCCSGLFPSFQSYLLYKGAPGQSGGSGGEYGLGGQGGIAGEIVVKSTVSGQSPKITQIARQGKNGENGRGGLYGENGKTGWDMGYLDFQTWKGAWYFGRDQNSKVTLRYSDDGGSDKVWCKYWKKYVTLVSGSIEHKKNRHYNERQSSRRNNERKAVANATRKNAISQSNIQNSYSEYSKSVGKLQDLSLDIETSKRRTLGAIADLQQRLQAYKQTAELTIQHQVSSANLTERKPPINIQAKENFKDNDTSDEVKLLPRLTADPQSLDNWLKLGEVRVSHSKLKELFNTFDRLRNTISANLNSKNDQNKNKLETIEKILLNKYRFNAMEGIAKQLPTRPKITDRFEEITAESAAKYLIDGGEEEKATSHPVLGTLHKYFYQNTEEIRASVSKFFKDNLQSSQKNREILKHSIKRFIPEVGTSEEANPSIKKYYQEYVEFKENYESTLNVYLEAFRAELAKPRHSAMYKLWIASNKDKSLRTELESKILVDPFLKVLYERCKNQLKLDYDWAKCCADQVVLNEFNYLIIQKGPISESYRELLAFVFNINIRLYAEDEDNKFYLQDNHNPTSTVAIHILNRGELEFVQLVIDKEFWRLEEERRINDNVYAKVLDDMESFKVRQDYDGYLKKQTFLASGEIERMYREPSVYDEEGDLRKIIEYFPEDDRQLLQLRLEKITSQFVTQPGILHHIAWRFCNEGRHVSLQELFLLINSVMSASIEESTQQATFSWIVSAYPQVSWINELLLLQLENYLRKPLARKTMWREYLAKIDNVNTLLLLNLKLDQHHKVSSQTLEDILNLLCSIPKEAVIQLDGLQLSEWPYALKEKYWNNKLTGLIQWKESDLATATYYILSMEFKFGTDLIEQFIETLKNKMQQSSVTELIKILSNFHTEEWSLSKEVVASLRSLGMKQWQAEMQRKLSADKDRNITQLVEVIDGNTNTSEAIANSLSDHKVIVQKISDGSYTIAGKAVRSFTEDDIKTWAKEFKKKLGQVDRTSRENMFAVLDRAIQVKRGWRLRDTQWLTTLVLLTNKHNTLVQMATGEGKSIVVVVLSIMKNLLGQKVDVVTSSSVLAKRDAEENSDIYALFDVSVSHNCSEEVDKRKVAYSANQVVYGDLSNFQRDYLLDKFYGKNILGDRNFENVIIDEVDSMLLDKGNNVLYLSHDLAGFDKLESLYIYIWQWLNRPAKDPDEIFAVLDAETIKEAVLNDLYGIVKKEDMDMMGPELTEQQKHQIYERLMKAKLIDDRGLLLRQTVDDAILLNEVLSPEFMQYQGRLSLFFKHCFERERRIHVPNYLRPFIERHLDSWIENAKIALFMESGLDYVVDVDRTQTSPDRNPNITILDRDTGTDQVNSQWDEALHQFLQLKHGCKLSLQSLKAVFISNVTYFKLYRNLYGLTGTLGSQRERDLLQDIHKVDFVTIPTSKSKKFVEYNPIICSHREEWINQIRTTVKNLTETRSVLIICETVKDVGILHKAFGGKGAKDVHTYTRDYEAFDLAKGGKKLDKGHVIIATNLAGRGTDIKITSELEKAGGLHVCITYLPGSMRIEQQAFGRAARKGENGSGQLIVMDTRGEQSHHTTILNLRQEANVEEMYHISAIKDYYETQIVMEEKSFNAFKDQYEKLKAGFEKEEVPGPIMDILLHSCLDKWAFWLDENGKQIKNIQDEQSKRHFDDLLSKFITQLRMPTNVDDSKIWLFWAEGNPPQMIKLAKQLSLAKSKDVQNAIMLFDEVIRSEPNFSEAAHYYKAYALAKQINWEHKPVDQRKVIEFKKQLQEAARLFGQRRESAIINAGIVGQLKADNDDSIIQIYGYEEQQKSFANLYFIFSQSIEDILGQSISPKWFSSKGVNVEWSEDLYEALLRVGVLKRPRVKMHLPQEKLKDICSGYGVSVDPLMKFLSRHEGLEVHEQAFLQSLREAVPLPSREGFWEELVHQGVLIEDFQYDIVGSVDILGSDSYLGKRVMDKITNNKLKKVDFKSNENYILLKAEMIEKLGNNANIFERAQCVEALGNADYQKLKKFGVIKSNRSARVDKSKAELVIFHTHDSISIDDFAMINIVRNEADKIMAELVEKGVIEKKNGVYRLKIRYDEIEQFHLTCCPVYETLVKGLLTACFAYRLALQRILRQLEERDFPVRLHLMTKPHQRLLSELFEQKIIWELPIESTKEDVEGALKKLVKESGLQLGDQTIESITADIEKAKGTLQALETPDGQLKDLTKVCGECDFGNIEEVQLFLVNGLDQLLQMEEKKWTMKMILNAALVIAMGIAQVAIGTAIELFSAGAMTNVAAAFLSEGIGDIVFAVGALRSGYFSWKDYGAHKLESIIITAATAGVGAIVSRFNNAARFGQKLAGPLFGAAGAKAVGLKAVGKEIAKRTIITTIKKVSFSIANEGVDMVIDNAVKNLCSGISKSILSDIQQKVEKHDVSKTLERAYSVLGETSATRLVDNLSQYIFTRKSIGHYFINIFKKVYFDCVEAFGKVAKNMSSSVAKFVIQTITKTIVWSKKLIHIGEIMNVTTNFLNGLNQQINAKLANHHNRQGVTVTDKDMQKFKADVLDKWKSLLQDKIGELVQKYIISPIVEKASQLIKRVGKIFKKVYRSRHENRYRDKFDELKKKYHKDLQDSSKGEEGDVNALPENYITEKYHRDMQRLMMKTKNPKLFAAIVRENMPMDIACVGACVKVVDKIIGEQGGGVGGITIVAEGEDGIRHSFSSGRKGVVVRLKLQGNHFQISQDGGLETSKEAHVSLYEALKETIPELHKVSPIDFRDRASRLIEHDDEIKEYIQKRWIPKTDRTFPTESPDPLDRLQANISSAQGESSPNLPNSSNNDVQQATVATVQGPVRKDN